MSKTSLNKDMKIKELIESSPDTPRGSVSRDLILSKMWITTSLEVLGLDDFDDVYVLGSWYGSMATVLKHSSIIYHNLFCVEINEDMVRYFDQVIKQKGWNDVVSLHADADTLEYHGENLLVINASTNDMKGSEWLEQIPKGSTVVLQGKNHQEVSNGVDTLEKFDRAHLLATTLMLKELNLLDVHGDPYTRFMKIGFR